MQFNEHGPCRATWIGSGRAPSRKWSILFLAHSQVWAGATQVSNAVGFPLKASIDRNVWIVRAAAPMGCCTAIQSVIHPVGPGLGAGKRRMPFAYCEWMGADLVDCAQRSRTPGSAPIPFKGLRTRRNPAKAAASDRLVGFSVKLSLTLSSWTSWQNRGHSNSGSGRFAD